MPNFNENVSVVVVAVIAGVSYMGELYNYVCNTGQNGEFTILRDQYIEAVI